MFLSLAGSVWAAVPFELPPGETPSEWTAALTLAGFKAGDVGVGVGVELVAAGETWRVVVHDPRGGTRTVGVAPPATMQARQDIAWMAQSLLDPVVVPVLVQRAPPIAAVARPAAGGAMPRGDPPGAQSPARASPPRPKARPPGVPDVGELAPAAPAPTEPAAATPIAPEPTVANPELAVAVPDALGLASPAATGAPEAPPERVVVLLEDLGTASRVDTLATGLARVATAPGVAVHASVGGGVRVRGGATTAALVASDVGLHAGSWMVVGAISGLGGAALRDIAPQVDGRVWGMTTLLLAGWQAPWRVAPELGIGGGAVYYRFVNEGTIIEEKWVPVAVAAAGVSVAVVPRLRVSAAARAAIDADVLHLRVNGVEAGGWSAWSIEPLVRVIYEPVAAAR